MTAETNDKQTLIRFGYIAGSLLAYMIYLFIFGTLIPFYKIGLTIEGIIHFAVSLGLIWFNIRKTPTAIKQIIIAILLSGFAIVMMAFKLEGEALSGYYAIAEYRTARRVLAFVILLIATHIPISADKIPIAKITKTCKVMMWSAILLLDFAVAFPNINFVSQNQTELYIGHKSEWHTGMLPDVYAIRSGGNDFYVISRTDEHVDILHGERYYKGKDYIVGRNTQDTIWIRPFDPNVDTEEVTIENTNQSLTRWQWQYVAWQWVKDLFER